MRGCFVGDGPLRSSEPAEVLRRDGALGVGSGSESPAGQGEA